MAQLWRNPYNSYRPWSACQTCGQSWPSQKITYNPRFGWQCPPCWDGLIQHDQYQQPIFPYEGTRKVNSPIVNSLLEGIAPGSLYQTYIYNFRDRATGDLYLVHLYPFTVTAGGVLTWTGTSVGTLILGNDPVNVTYDGMRATNSYNLIVQNGALTTEPWNPISQYAPYIAQGICDFGPVEVFQAFLLYDRTYPDEVWEVIFHGNNDATFPGQIEVIRASGSAVGGIQLADDWSFFIDSFDPLTGITGPPGSGQGQYNQVAYAPEIPWDNSHQFYVDTITYSQPILIYIP